MHLDAKHCSLPIFKGCRREMSEATLMDPRAEHRSDPTRISLHKTVRKATLALATPAFV